jgi:uncharacterized protein with FMN-binding domain
VVSGVQRVVLWVMCTLTVLVLLFSYHTSTSGPGATTGSSTFTAEGTSSTGSGTTVDGPSVDTRWGPVQVRITVDGGRLTGVELLQYPDGNGRDEEINARALPILVSESVDAQSADIDMVSGATVTSEGYVQSLQAALDAAGL